MSRSDLLQVMVAQAQKAVTNATLSHSLWQPAEMATMIVFQHPGARRSAHEPCALLQMRAFPRAAKQCTMRFGILSGPLLKQAPTYCRVS